METSSSYKIHTARTLKLALNLFYFFLFLLIFGLSPLFFQSLVLLTLKFLVCIQFCFEDHLIAKKRVNMHNLESKTQCSQITNHCNPLDHCARSSKFYRRKCFTIQNCCRVASPFFRFELHIH